MTEHKDFKRLVRTRMTRTGESYTTARAHLLSKPVSGRRSAPARPADVAAGNPAPTEFADLAGMSDAAIKKGSGCAWPAWVKSLDHVKAWNWPHREIVLFVREKYGVGDWWAQGVTVGYERIKGLRAIGQRRGGGYEVSKSKMLPVAVGRLYRAFSERRQRQIWLGAVEFTVRRATKNKSLRITWADGTSVEIMFYAKGSRKAQVTLQHTRLPDKAAADRVRAYWTERFGALAGLVAPAT